MLLRCERIVALRAEVMVLDIVVLVLAVGRLGRGQVRDRGEDRVELGRIPLLLGLERRDRVLQRRDLRQIGRASCRERV